MEETKILSRTKIDEMWLVEEKCGANSEFAIHFMAGGKLHRFGYEDRSMPPGTYISEFKPTATHESCYFFDQDSGKCRCKESRFYRKTFVAKSASCECYINSQEA